MTQATTPSATSPGNGSTTAAPKASSTSISTRPGATTPRNISAANPLDRLLLASVRENEAALGRYLKHSGVFLTTDTLDLDLVHDGKGEWLGSMPVAPGKTLTFYVPPDCPTAKLEPLYAALCRACSPLPANEVTKGLAALMVLCKIKGMDADETTLALTLFKEKLAEYPADAVVWALSEWPEHNTFFPAWAELKATVLAHCWARLRVRDRLADFLQKRR